MNQDLLIRLSEVSGVSGDEGRVRQLLADALRPQADRCHRFRCQLLHDGSSPCQLHLTCDLSRRPTPGLDHVTQPRHRAAAPRRHPR